MRTGEREQERRPDSHTLLVFILVIKARATGSILLVRDKGVGAKVATSSCLRRRLQWGWEM